MASDNHAKPSLGILRATSLVTGNIIGAGLFMLPASLGMYGSIGILGLILTSLGSICLAFVFARLSHDFPKIGGPYAYSKEAFGDFIGFQMAWSYWIGTWASVAAIAVAFVSYLSVFWPFLNENLAVAYIVCLITIWLFTFVNLAGIKTASSLQVITTVLKILPLAVIVFCGIPEININHFSPLNPTDFSFWSALTTASALTLFSFVGLESATIPAEDVLEPAKTIPRATILGTILAALIYLATMVVILGMLSPAELGQSKAPFVDAGAIIFGSWAGPLVAGAAIVSTLGTLNGWILVQGQVPVAAAKDGVFPSFFEKLNAKGAPYIALIISSALMSLLLFSNYNLGLVEQFNSIIVFTSFTILLPYLYSSLAELYILLVNPEKTISIKSIVIAAIAFIFTIIISIGAGERAVYMGMILVFSGFPFYVWMKRKNNRSH